VVLVCSLLECNWITYCLLKWVGSSISGSRKKHSVRIEEEINQGSNPGGSKKKNLSLAT
jgi:hypothetical protein